MLQTLSLKVGVKVILNLFLANLYFTRNIPIEIQNLLNKGVQAKTVDKNWSGTVICEVCKKKNKIKMFVVKRKKYKKMFNHNGKMYH